MGVDLQTLSPREIQARVRAGASVEQVVSETGWPLDKVTRYAEPPLRERAYIVELAQRAQVRGPGGSHALGDLVADSWRSAQWDAFRNEDGRWRVTATSEGTRATWIYEPSGRSVTAVDDVAAHIVGREPSGSSTPIVEYRAPDATPVVEVVEVERPRLVPVPDPTPDVADSPGEPPHAAETTEHTPRPSKKTRRGRARVPSWDEILFGATRNDE